MEKKIFLISGVVLLVVIIILFLVFIRSDNQGITSFAPNSACSNIDTMLHDQNTSVFQLISSNVSMYSDKYKLTDLNCTQVRDQIYFYVKGIYTNKDMALGERYFDFSYSGGSWSSGGNYAYPAFCFSTKSVTIAKIVQQSLCDELVTELKDACLKKSIYPPVGVSYFKTL